MIVRADRETKGQIETLLNDGTLDMQVHEEITYEDMREKGEGLFTIISERPFPDSRLDFTR